MMQNFGIIHETYKEVFANNIVKGDKKIKKLFIDYVKQLKENKILRTQFEIYDKLENKIEGDFNSSTIFVDECISILKGLNSKLINELNVKLINNLKENNISLIEDYEFKNLHEHINRLTFINKSPKNIESIIESKLFLNNYNKSKIIKESRTIEPYINKFLGPVMIDKFNEKYSSLTEDEKKLFKMVVNGSSEKNEEFFNSSILECVDLINLKLNEECTINEKDKFLQVKDKLLRYHYDKETFMSEISKITSLKESLK